MTLCYLRHIYIYQTFRRWCYDFLITFTLFNTLKFMLPIPKKHFLQNNFLCEICSSIFALFLSSITFRFKLEFGCFYFKLYISFCFLPFITSILLFIYCSAQLVVYFIFNNSVSVSTENFSNQHLKSFSQKVRLVKLNLNFIHFFKPHLL